ncbi:MAG: hypothetical protein JO089_07225 [Alphaproteobacteria bacterium]|nr:hypothetical protein [Alphaproteobacteria bacterium]
MTEELKPNGTLRCYHQFPRHYANFSEMTAQLGDIGDMGFNAVWVGPLHPVSQVPKKSGEQGSLYAITDPRSFREEFFGTADVEAQKQMVRKYTAEAKNRGLVPMFDLVLKHMGKGSSLERNEEPRLPDTENIDTSHWFKSETFRLNGQVWDDVTQLDYSKPEIRRQIIDHLWKPFVRMYIEELGFQGIRIDAAQHFPSEVVKEIIGYARELWDQQGVQNPFIMAEVLGSTKDQRHGLKGCGITHITNYSYWLPNQYEPARYGKPDCSLMAQQAFSECWKSEIAHFSNEKGHALHVVRLGPGDEAYANTVGATVGFADFHDEHSMAWHIRNAWKGRSEEDIRKQIEKAMREEIATVAFCSDGGWFAATGFEVADARPRSVFQCAENAQPSQPNADLRAFIKEVNAIVKARPALGLFNWTERIFLNGKPELAIFKTRDEREPGKPVYLKIANTDPDKHPLLTDDDMKKLGPADRVYICGGVQMQNPDQAVTPAVIAAQPANDVGSVRSAAAR